MFDVESAKEEGKKSLNNSFEEINNTKKLNKITNVLGKEIIENNNTLLFYIYDDGTVEKRITIE